MAFEDSAHVLLSALKDNRELVLGQITQEKYDEYVKIMTKLAAREQEEGKF